MSDREDYRRQIEAQLDSWSDEIEKLQTRAAQAGADARVEYDRQIDALRDRQRDLRQKFEQMQQAQGEAWKEFKSGIDTAWNDMNQAMKKATEKLR